MNTSEKGATLLELLIAVVMVSVVVAGLAIVFPKSSQTITNNRRRWLANNFAAARIQSLKQQPYAVISATPAGVSGGYFTNTNNASPPACDCSTVDWCKLGQSLGPDASYTESSITYTRQVCVNLVDHTAGGWTSYCPDNNNIIGTDKGLKNIRVRVYWIAGTDVAHTDAESLVTQ